MDTQCAVLGTQWRFLQPGSRAGQVTAGWVAWTFVQQSVPWSSHPDPEPEEQDVLNHKHVSRIYKPTKEREFLWGS